MRFLFVKSRLAWPRTHGHDVHGFEMMRALSALGHPVALATDIAPSPEAIAGLPLAGQWVLEDGASGPVAKLSYLQERYRSYWGIGHGRIAALGQRAAEWQADVVVVVGLEILPYLAGPRSAKRVWYAADEWVWHYVSQMATDPAHIVDHARQAAIKGLYERAYGPLMDRVWVVSEAERRAMRLVSGCRHVDVLPNGVDAETFVAVPAEVRRQSAVFWGRLGFGPNLQALRWFVAKVWPLVRRRAPEASFSILGADPPPEVTVLDGRDGISVVANPIDLRPAISRAEVVVLPFVSGGGIKNKFLEAASMSRPIVATTRATRGLRSSPPARIADEPSAFAEAILHLWNEPDRGTSLGRSAREWVQKSHTWTATAAEAVRGLTQPAAGH
jgi:glycosyltransferase involved in cell wall biosynthesis